MSRLLPIALLVVACGGVDPEIQEAFDDRLALGPYAVGYRQVDVTYTPTTSDEARTLSVELWYPAEDGGDAARYAVVGVVDIDSDVATTGPLVAGDALPVAVYTHGNGGLGLVGYPYGEYLASRGWVVLAPDHKGNTALELLTGAGDPFLKSTVERPQDVSAVLDWVETVSDDELAGRTDTSAVLVIGHSFGGYTAFAAGGATPSAERLDPGCPDADNPSCALLEDPLVQQALAAGFADPRVAALVPQAPAIRSFDPMELTDLTLPVMLQSGAKDITTEPETSSIPTWEAIDGADDVWIDMPNGGHITFLSICDDLTDDLIESFQPSAFMDGCGPGFIPPVRALPVLNAYLGLFADTHVLGDDQTAVIEEVVPPAGFVLELK